MIALLCVYAQETLAQTRPHFCCKRKMIRSTCLFHSLGTNSYPRTDARTLPGTLHEQWTACRLHLELFATHGCRFFSFPVLLPRLCLHCGSRCPRKKRTLSILALTESSSSPSPSPPSSIAVEQPHHTIIVYVKVHYFYFPDTSSVCFLALKSSFPNIMFLYMCS